MLYSIKYISFNKENAGLKLKCSIFSIFSYSDWKNLKNKNKNSTFGLSKNFLDESFLNNHYGL